MTEAEIVAPFVASFTLPTTTPRRAGVPAAAYTKGIMELVDEIAATVEKEPEMLDVRMSLW